MGICDSESGSEYSSDSVRIAARAQLGIDLILDKKGGLH